MSLGKRLGLAWVFVWFMGGGVAHFLPSSSPFFISIVPPYIPWPVAAVYVSGLCEILGAVGVLIPEVRRWAGLGLFLLTLAVTPANVWMMQHPELYPDFPAWTLKVRLLVQVALLANIWWCTGIGGRRAVPEMQGVRT